MIINNKQQTAHKVKLHTFVKDISPDKESRGITNPLAKDRVISREKKKVNGTTSASQGLL